MASDDAKEALAVQDPIVQQLVRSPVNHGVLIPLKTNLELGDDYVCGRILITRTPVKSANALISLLRGLLPEDIVKGFPHLRRCAKPSDLPAHLRARFMNETPEGRQIHTGKANWIYVIIGSEQSLSRQEIAKSLSTIEGLEDEIFLQSVPVPMVAPISQVQAAMWSQHFWPTIYRKNNPLGPHPAKISRSTEEISNDATIWMTLAHQVARQSKDAGYGEPIGACIVHRSGNKTTVVALAGDARWRGSEDTDDTGDADDKGNPMAHAVLRAISMVAQKLVRAEERPPKEQPDPILEFDAFQDSPILPDEEKVFELDHPNPNGYLCHDLEVYVTHEPCVMCSMAILHSRVGRVIFRHRMPLTGGLCAEDRGHGHSHPAGPEAGRGLGLFWRRELNWSLLGWEWESAGFLKSLLVNYEVHA